MRDRRSSRSCSRRSCSASRRCTRSSMRTPSIRTRRTCSSRRTAWFVCLFPAEVVALAGPALRDLRLVRSEGIETPFAVVSMPVDTSSETRTAAVVPLEASQNRTGTEPAVFVETYNLAVPPPPDAGGEWSLNLAIPGRTFTARITLSSAETRSAVVPRDAHRLPARGRIVADARSPSRGRGFEAPRSMQGESGFLSPTFSRESRAVSRPLALEVPVATMDVGHANGATIVELAPPGGLFVNGVRIDSRSVGYSRPVRVFARVNGEPFLEVGSGAIANVSGGGAETQSLAFASVAAERLRIVVEDGVQSPPLEAPSLAVARRPAFGSSSTPKARSARANRSVSSSAGVARFVGPTPRKPSGSVARTTRRCRSRPSARSSRTARTARPPPSLSPCVRGRASIRADTSNARA